MTDTPTDTAERDVAAGVGRPTLYTPELGDKLCALIALGSSLRTICRDDDMPDASTVYRWLRLHNDFRDNYEKARADQADALADEILEIADDGRNDWMERHNNDGSTAYAINGEHVQRSRLQCRQPQMDCLEAENRRNTATRSTRKLPGADGVPLVPTEITVTVVRPKPSEG